MNDFCMGEGEFSLQRKVKSFQFLVEFIGKSYTAEYLNVLIEFKV